ncbi:hypothetical protein A4X09_0g448 [Tilletia walkeri]|uniref:Zinc finger PHD-type domain-containing protein n=1 Tax=Tilletia walkeri TaxID=117179 RepID=A0A8X7T7L1_9BASI|nr:hypothetical protein A4X09_0g448 [Tilletia walkeri]
MTAQEAAAATAETAVLSNKESESVLAPTNTAAAADDSMTAPKVKDEEEQKQQEVSDNNDTAMQVDTQDPVEVTKEAESKPVPPPTVATSNTTAAPVKEDEKEEGEIAEDEQVGTDDIEVKAAVESAPTEAVEPAQAEPAATAEAEAEAEAGAEIAPPAAEAEEGAAAAATADTDDSAPLTSNSGTRDSSSSPGDADEADTTQHSSASKKKGTSNKKGKSPKKGGGSTKSRKSSAGRSSAEADAGDETVLAADHVKAEGEDETGETSNTGTAADEEGDYDEEDSENEEGERSHRSPKRKKGGNTSASTAEGKAQRAAAAAKELAYLGLQNLGDGEQEPILPRRSRRAAFDVGTQQENDQGQGSSGLQDGSGGDDDDMTAEVYGNEEPDGDGGDEGVTRCVCGSTDENVGLMIQCEDCKCWQHCICMGMEFEDDCPDVYFCEQCKPELHIPLLKQLGVLKENGAFGNHKNNGSSGKKGVIMGPNGKPSKNPARDQARELREAKEAVARLAQENAQRHREAAAAVEQDPAAVSYQKERKGSHDRSRKRSESHDVVDMTPGGSSSSGAGAAALRSPKRRNTMNSRDSAYGWEPIPPGLLNDDEVWDDVPSERNSRKRQRSIKEEDEDDATDEENGPAEQPKRRRLSTSVKPVEEPEPVVAPRLQKKKSKPKAKAPEDPNAPPRPKHPNQYTYRPKVKPAETTPVAKENEVSLRAVTPALGRPASPTPSPSKNRDRRGAAATAGSRTGTPTPSVNPGAAWGLPEHLWPLAHYLPAPAPTPLVVRVPSTKGIPRGAVAAAAAERNSAKRGASGSAAAAASANRATPQPFNLLELSESASRVRFPGKRMTMGEMRKRVRNISEFVTRMQLEAVERGKRTAALGIKAGGGLPYDSTRMGLGLVSSGTPAPQQSGAVPMDVDSRTTEAESSNARSGDASSAESQNENAPGSTSTMAQLPQSMLLLESLTGELLTFQRKFGLSGQVYHTGSTPVWPGTSAGGSGSSASASGLGLDLGNAQGATAVLDA